MRGIGSWTASPTSVAQRAPSPRCLLKQPSRNIIYRNGDWVWVIIRKSGFTADIYINKGIGTGTRGIGSGRSLNYPGVLGRGGSLCRVESTPGRGI